MDDLIFEVSKINIKDGDVLIIKSNDVTIEQLGKLHEHLTHGGLKDLRIIKLNHEDDIQSMNEEQMNLAGWFREN